jgi:ABC-type transport system involved in cytochrome c biogenesis permease subunit
MMSSDFEYILANLSFTCLFAMVIWYWVKTFFSLSSSLHFIGTFGMAAANLSLTGLLVSRWLTSGHFPLSNLFESLLFLSWGFTVSHLILERISNADFIGVITSPMSFLTNAFASFTLPHEMQKATALIPALQSNWLMMHVTIMMMSYVALISGSLLSIAFLVISYLDSKKSKPLLSRVESFFPLAKATDSSRINYQRDLKNNAVAYQEKFGFLVKTQSSPNSIRPDPIQWKATVSPQEDLVAYPQLPVLAPSSARVESDHRTPQPCEQKVHKTSRFSEAEDLSPFAQTLDNLSYRTLGLGFPLLTIGILSGAVWANEAWGSYWSWDPKETWAFITWLVFAIYLHTRLGKGWKGTKPATIAAAGFFVVWICYLGVNLLGTGLHSYGWLQSGR